MVLIILLSPELSNLLSNVEMIILNDTYKTHFFVYRYFSTGQSVKTKNG